MQRFNIRVYGILINERRQVLVSDELIRGNYYTKFPGGGMEYGEGTRDCLQREFMEEMNLRVDVGAHIYTTDYFQQSAFHPDHQLISIYYFVTPLEKIETRISSEPFEFDDRQLEVYKNQNETESFRFLEWEAFSPESVTLPIDKIVVTLLKPKD